MKSVRLLVGTTKGVFFLRAPAARTAWQVEGPHLAGRAIYSLAHDGRGGRQRVWAGAASMHWGAVLVATNDWGRTWDEPQEANVKFPADTGLALKQIWEIARGLLDHPHRERWTPGGGGLCLHTIVRDPENADRMWIAISSGGVYRTADGGRTWTARNAGIRAEFLPEKYPEFGQCVHKVVQHPSRP